MTKEEIAKLKENLHKIEDYVRKNYIQGSASAKAYRFSSES